MSDAPDHQALIDALAHLICADRENPALPRSQLPGIGGAEAHLAFDGFEILGQGSDDVLLPLDLSDLPVWPLDVCVATQAGESWSLPGWQFTRIRSLDQSLRREWRGKAHRYLPRSVDLTVCVTTQDGIKNSVRMPLGLLSNSVVDLRNAKQLPEDAEQQANMIAIAGGLSLRRRYHWSVLLGEGAGPRARFITDLTGVRSAFRLRDIPPGKERRAALRHWVREHWRQRRRSDIADRTWIREHLRGADRFVWNGLRCQMVRPELDADA